MGIGQKGASLQPVHRPGPPAAGLIDWEGNWRQLQPVREFAVQWDIYPRAWNTIDFARLLAHTLLHAFVTLVGTVVASSCRRR
ncbi:MAG: hypothetical protein OXG85_14595 [Chloroflexi bacterium]|nr:hypothetical protein [Chloroflexota bacterium]